MKIDNMSHHSVGDKREVGTAVTDRRRPYRISGGKYCCMPGCRSSSAKKNKLFLIPTLEGQRRGLPLKSWAEEFHRAVFLYRNDPDFMRRVRQGRVFICSRHFNPSDVVRTNFMTNLRHGALPTLNMQQKSQICTSSCKKKSTTKRTPQKIQPQKSKPQTLLIKQISKNFHSSPHQGWRLHQISSNEVNLAYYHNELFHATPSISLMITDLNNQPQCSIAFGGVHAPTVSNALEFKTRSLQTFLKNLSELNACALIDCGCKT